MQVFLLAFYHRVGGGYLFAVAALIMLASQFREQYNYHHPGQEISAGFLFWCENGSRCPFYILSQDVEFEMWEGRYQYYRDIVLTQK